MVKRGIQKRPELKITISKENLSQKRKIGTPKNAVATEQQKQPI